MRDTVWVQKRRWRKNYHRAQFLDFFSTTTYTISHGFDLNITSLRIKNHFIMGNWWRSFINWITIKRLQMTLWLTSPLLLLLIFEIFSLRQKKIRVAIIFSKTFVCAKLINFFLFHRFNCWWCFVYVIVFTERGCLTWTQIIILIYCFQFFLRRRKKCLIQD